MQWEQVRTDMLITFQVPWLSSHRLWQQNMALLRQRPADPRRGLVGVRGWGTGPTRVDGEQAGRTAGPRPQRRRRPRPLSGLTLSNWQGTWGAWHLVVYKELRGYGA